MNKKYTITIELEYSNVQDSKELKQAITDETKSWVQSGSFGEDLYCESNADLVSYEVKCK